MDYGKDMTDFSELHFVVAGDGLQRGRGRLRGLQHRIVGVQRHTEKRTVVTAQNKCDPCRGLATFCKHFRFQELSEAIY